MEQLITGQEICEEARRWVGTPFRHQGRTPLGVDCIGLVICVRVKFGPLPYATDYQATYRRNPQALLLTAMQATCTEINAPEAGCVALIGWPKQKHPSHVAILTPETMIHAYSQSRAVIETSYGQPWDRWTHSLWRLPGVTP